MTKSRAIGKTGQGTLEFFLIVAFITVGLMIGVKFFFPSLQQEFAEVGNIVKNAVASGLGFK